MKKNNSTRHCFFLPTSQRFKVGLVVFEDVAHRKSRCRKVDIDTQNTDFNEPITPQTCPGESTNGMDIVMALEVSNMTT